MRGREGDKEIEGVFFWMITYDGRWTSSSGYNCRDSCWSCDRGSSSIEFYRAIDRSPRYVHNVGSWSRAARRNCGNGGRTTNAAGAGVNGRYCSVTSWFAGTMRRTVRRTVRS